MKTKLRSPIFVALLACLGLVVAPTGCEKDPDADSGDGDGDGDGDTDTGDAEGMDADQGDGDGDTGDGDGDSGDGDGDGDTTGDGDGDTAGDLPNGATCTSDGECESGNCYVVPFLGGQCGECNEDADCPDGGCTPPNPFESNGSTCNMGEAGGGCESDSVCQDGLSCGTVLDLLGLITISTCGECNGDGQCDEGLICEPIVVVEEFSGQNTCIEPNTLPQDSFCDLGGGGNMGMGAGNEACESGICSTIDIMGLAEVGACGQCNIDDDCEPGQTCQAGEFILDTGTLVGSSCI